MRTRKFKDALKEPCVPIAIVAWGLIGMSIFALSQLGELTTPIVGALLLALWLGGGYQLSCRIKALEVKMANEQVETDKHCPGCGFPIDRSGFLKDQDYSKDAKYDCPNCGRNLITIKASGVK